MALCSLSIGSRVAPPCLTASINKLPAITKVSLFASKIRLPALAAAIAGFKPAAPTIAAMMVSTSASLDTCSKYDIPDSTIVLLLCLANSSNSMAAAATSNNTAYFGLKSRHCFSSTLTLVLAVNANTW